MKKLLTFACMAMLLAACHKDDKTEEEIKAERTVLVYMAAENNLSTFADEDLAELRKGSRNLGNNHLLVYVDKAEAQLPYLLDLRNGVTADSVEWQTDERTSNPAFFEQLINFAFSKYQAKSYGLVLWGHASGWLVRNDSVAYNAMARRRAYGGDTGNNTQLGPGTSWMNIPSMAKALGKVPHLDFIFADCCNFMCAESAYELRNVTDYLIGSPAEIPAVGAPYETVVPAMMEPTTFWKSIVDRYYEQVSELGNRVPLSVVKTSAMTDLATATREVLGNIKPKLTENFPDMAGLIYYYDNNLYDMNDFMLKYADASEYQSWKNALSQAVVYKKMATTWDTAYHVYFNDFDMTEEKFGGLSMFVPRWALQRSDNEYIRKMGWYYAAGYADMGW